VPTTASLRTVSDETLQPAFRQRIEQNLSERVVMTILHHHDSVRIGDRAELFEVGVNATAEVGRAIGDFGGQPLDDPFLSRRPWVLQQHGGRVSISAGGSPLRVNGVPTNDTAFSLESLSSGAVLTLAERVVLLLHTATRRPNSTPGRFLGQSDSAQQLRDEVARVADLAIPVLIRGESGTGKELVAEAIHAASPRGRRPWVAVNMSALSETTAVAELFGHSRGAFTGADRSAPGHFGRAAGSTLFLDEIGEASMSLQALLLRALESGEVQPVGGGPILRPDVRVLTATDADLEQLVTEGRFRDPLRHRIGAYEIHVSPLRERRSDLGLLLRAFLEMEMRELGESEALRPRDARDASWLGALVAERLFLYGWPGNVRQLRNAARQICVASRGGTHAVFPEVLDRLLVAGETRPADKRRSERVRPSALSPAELEHALSQHRFEVTETATALGISRTTLYRLIDAHPTIRRARDIGDAELRAAFETHNGDLVALSSQFKVGRYALSTRLKALGLTTKSQ
jgi:DNA-binding NtrC family response regulator